MIFSFKNDNYKNFNIFKDNILAPRAYFIPFPSYEAAKKSDIRTERYSSEKIKLLSGEWQFKYFAHVSEMPENIDTDAFCFDSVEVPSLWQFTGYEKPYYLNIRYPFKADPPHFPEDCPVSVYLKKIELDDDKKTRFITFLGVMSSIDLFVNGKYIGYSEGSHNSAEFDITEALKKGENEIAVVVHKWCNGTYLECQDMFRNNGIFRDVYITEHESAYIYDIDVKTKFGKSGAYDLDIKLNVCADNDCRIKAVLEFDGNTVAGGKISADKNVKISFKEVFVNEWSAESPCLYDLYIILENKDGVIEAIKKKVGFKHIEIKGNVFYFNNQKIKLLGVNHHDTNPKTGYCMTVSDMEKDVQIFKEYNINAVRTSHYPPDPIFLDLCDEYGIYVVDEADIECHGIANMPMHRGDCSDNPEWREHYFDRVYRMYQRDRNHASIVMWSLGNESHGISNQDHCYKELKKLTDIPVHYEAACRTRRWAYDVISQMYQTQNCVKKIGKGSGMPLKYYKKPYFLCEYAHAMGVGAGDTEEYIKSFLEYDNILGGCVWEFADHAVYHENGEIKYTYGGDHNEEFHDGCFCVDGLFFPDRTPHAGALQIKNCYRPVRAETVGERSIRFRCINYFVGKSLLVKWNALSINGNECGEFEINVKAQGFSEKELNITKPYDALVLRYYENGREIACEQLERNVTLVSFDKCTSKPEKYNSESKYIFKTESGETVYDKDIGQIISVKIGEKEIINRSPLADNGINISLFRAPLDNDRNYRWWKKYRLDTEHTRLVSSKKLAQTDNAYVIENVYSLSTVSVKNILKAVMKFTVYGDGSLCVYVKCIKSKKLNYCPRFGVCVELKRDFDTVTYFGLGDRENLCDFREHAMLGEYTAKTNELCERYIKPQESSMRTETRYVRFTDSDGVGLEFAAINKPFIFSADNFTSYQCAKSMHPEELDSFNSTVIHIDSYMLGAGSNACGPKPDRKYVKNFLGGEELEFIIRPLK